MQQPADQDIVDNSQPVATAGGSEAMKRKAPKPYTEEQVERRRQLAAARYRAKKEEKELAKASQGMEETDKKEERVKLVARKMRPTKDDKRLKKNAVKSDMSDEELIRLGEILRWFDTLHRLDTEYYKLKGTKKYRMEMAKFMAELLNDDVLFRFREYFNSYDWIINTLKSLRNSLRTSVKKFSSGSKGQIIDPEDMPRVEGTWAFMFDVSPKQREMARSKSSSRSGGSDDDEVVPKKRKLNDVTNQGTISTFKTSDDAIVDQAEAEEDRSFAEDSIMLGAANDDVAKAPRGDESFAEDALSGDDMFSQGPRDTTVAEESFAEEGGSNETAVDSMPDLLTYATLTPVALTTAEDSAMTDDVAELFDDVPAPQLDHLVQFYSQPANIYRKPVVDETPLSTTQNDEAFVKQRPPVTARHPRGAYVKNSKPPATDLFGNKLGEKEIANQQKFIESRKNLEKCANKPPKVPVERAPPTSQRPTLPIREPPMLDPLDQPLSLNKKANGSQDGDDGRTAELDGTQGDEGALSGAVGQHDLGAQPSEAGKEGESDGRKKTLHQWRPSGVEFASRYEQLTDQRQSQVKSYNERKAEQENEDADDQEMDEADRLSQLASTMDLDSVSTPMVNLVVGGLRARKNNYNSFLLGRRVTNSRNIAMTPPSALPRPEDILEQVGNLQNLAAENIKNESNKDESYHFLMSHVVDMREMTPANKRKFKSAVLKAVDDCLPLQPGCSY